MSELPRRSDLPSIDFETLSQEIETAESLTPERKQFLTKELELYEGTTVDEVVWLKIPELKELLNKIKVEVGQGVSENNWESYYQKFSNRLQSKEVFVQRLKLTPIRNWDRQEAERTAKWILRMQPILGKYLSDPDIKDSAKKLKQAEDLKSRLGELSKSVEDVLQRLEIIPEQQSSKKEVRDLVNWPSYPEKIVGTNGLEKLYLDISTKLDGTQVPNLNEVKQFIKDLEEKIEEVNQDVLEAGQQVDKEYENAAEVKRHLRKTYIEESGDATKPHAKDVLKKLRDIQESILQADLEKRIDALGGAELVEIKAEAVDNSQDNLEDRMFQLRQALDSLRAKIAPTLEEDVRRGLEAHIANGEKQLVKLQNQYIDVVLSDSSTIPEFMALQNVLEKFKVNAPPPTSQDYKSLNEAWNEVNKFVKEQVDGKRFGSVLIGFSAEVLDRFKKELKDIEKKVNEFIIRLRAEGEIEKRWAQINATEKTTKESDRNTEYLNAPLKGDDIENAGIFPLVEHFLPPEKRREWELKINIYNGWVAAANKDIFKQFGWADATASRDKAASHVSFEDMIEFVKIPENRPLFNSLVNYFETPQNYFYYQDDKGKYQWVHPDDVAEDARGTGIAPIEDKDRKFVRISDSTPLKVGTHDYARVGNPDADKTSQGAPTIRDLLRRDHPDAMPSTIDAIQFIGMLGEIRLKYHRKYRAGYEETALPTFDVKPIAHHSPMSELTYKILSVGNIYPDYRMLWQIMRFPKAGGIYVEDATPETSRDERNHPGFGHEFLPVSDHSKTNPNGFYPDTKSVREAIEVRGFQDYALTTSDDTFTPVRLDESLTLIPFYWDIAFDELINEGGRKFNAITYQEYNESMKAWADFLHAAQYPDPIKSPEDVNDRIGGLVSILSRVKGILGIMPSGTEGGDRLRDVIKQMLLRFSKHIFDQYMEITKYGVKERVEKGLFKRDYFFEVAIHEFEHLNTLDKDIRKFLINTLEEHKSIWNRDNLFSEAKGNPFEPTENIFGFLKFGEIKRRKALVEQYLKKPPPEKKH